MVAIYITAPISGAGINPAVGFGLNLMSGLMAGNKASIAAMWPYLVGPLLGGAISGLLYKHFHCGISIF